MDKKQRIEPALKVDSGFKINLLCLEDNTITEEQRLSIARMVKESIERGQRILARNQNKHLALTITKAEQDFINRFLPEEEHLKIF